MAPADARFLAKQFLTLAKAADCVQFPVEPFSVVRGLIQESIAPAAGKPALFVLPKNCLDVL